MRCRRSVWLSGLAIALVLMLTMGTAFARYMEKENNIFKLKVKAQAGLTIEKQEWTETEDGYRLTFQMAAAAKNVQVYLAVSQGADAGNAAVTLTTPDGEQIQATGEVIGESSDLYSRFGGGYVFTFSTPMDLNTQAYVLTVTGLSVEEVSLLRLFLEYA